MAWFKIYEEFYTGNTGKKLRGDLTAIALAQFCISNPKAKWIGLYHLPLQDPVHYLGISEEKAREAYRRLKEIGFAEFDEKSEHLWVPEMLWYQVNQRPLKEKDFRFKNAHTLLSVMIKSPFYESFLVRYGEMLKLKTGELPGAKEVEPISEILADEIERITQTWATLYKNKNGKSPKGYASAKRVFTTLLQDHSCTDLCGWLVTFFRDSDEWVEGRDYTASTFRGQIPSIKEDNYGMGRKPKSQSKQSSTPQGGKKAMIHGEECIVKKHKNGSSFYWADGNWRPLPEGIEVHS